VNTEIHKWINAETLYCPDGGHLKIVRGDGPALYDMGVTKMLVTDGLCPECGEKVETEAQVNLRKYDREDLELQMLEEQEND
jgi:predicted RNA-binding Zn-ribbon protein involved in translation (DUF1610 family)